MLSHYLNIVIILIVYYCHRVRLITEDNNKNNEDEQLADDSERYSQNKDMFNKCETIEEGTFAFMHWLNPDNKKSLSCTDNPIVLLKFINDIDI
jgi:hypothetical protein